MSPRRFSTTLIVLLALGCRSRGASSRSIAPPAVDGGAPNVVDAGACGRRPEEVAGAYRDLCLSEAEVEQFAAAVREAIARGDRAKLASMVRYPFRVHTAHCMKHIDSPGDFVARYDELFNPALRADIAALRPPAFVQDGSIMLASRGRLWAWVGAEQRLLLGGVFLGERDLPGIACADRAIEPIPDSVWGTWAVSSVRAGPLEGLVSYPWDDWKRATLSVDREAGTVTSRLRDRQNVCKVLWLARELNPEPDDAGTVARCSAFESFYSPAKRTASRLLQASCPGGELVVGTGVLPEMIMIDDRTMVLRLGCEGIAVLKRRQGAAARPAPRLVPRGGACGERGLDCAPGTLCVAVSSEPLVERCRTLEEAGE